MAIKTTGIKDIRPLGMQWETKNPFIFCAYHYDKYPPGNENLTPNASLDGRSIGSDFHSKDGWNMYHGKNIPGFPGHPHRGFETITIVRQGIVDHSDSLGAAGRYGAGDVQWMTAGKGLQHSEMFPLLKNEEENTLELFQIWLNLPKKSKMAEPDFKMFWNEIIPRKSIKDLNNHTIEIEVIAGEFNDLTPLSPPTDSWASEKENEVIIWHLHLSDEAEIILPTSNPLANRSIYFYNGDNLQIGSNKIDSNYVVDVDPSINLNIKAKGSAAKLLVLQGIPINEPIVQHGPFVANSQQEIQQAFFDYQQTQFGGWPWPNYEHVHSKTQMRFAKFPDGKIENPA